MTLEGTPVHGQPDPFEAVRKRVAKKLHGFTPEFPADLCSWDMVAHKPEAKDFPVSELVLFTLRDLMGWPWSGHGEKIRWSVFGRVAEEPIAFEHRKFGFTVLRCHGAQISNSRIEGQIKTALKEVEKFLEPFAKQQVGQGEVLIANRFSEFDARYRFFRDLAHKAYARGAKPPKPSHLEDGVRPQLGDPFGGLNKMMAANRQGFFHSAAMVDSYFSALEHRLVLLRAFTGQPLKPGELLQFLASKWDDKLKVVLPVAGDPHAEQILGKMRRIKERIRNPFAHGGVENDNGSLFFNLPSIGAIPANFTRFGDSVRFSFIPIESDDHERSCATFDEFDRLLSSVRLAGPHRLMGASVDPSFDSGTLEMYREAITGGEAHLDAFIERWEDERMRHANMEY